MNTERLTFQELKSRVSIIDVATYLGYQFDRSKGISQPSFVLSDGRGDVLDRIYIKNPNDSSRQGYWRRNGLNNSGDVVSFVKENLSQFNVQGYNDLDKINNILHKFAGKEFNFQPCREYKSFSSTSLKFDPSRWEKVYSPQVRDKIFSSRNINTYTTLTFSKFIDVVQDRQQNGKYSYIGFPYVVPGSNEQVGYELRGVNGFKSKASGTNSSSGMWLATFTDNPSEIRHIYIAESAFDALAFYQIHKEKIDLQRSAFVSFGGSFSDQQFVALQHQYPTSRLVLLFDADLNGHMYDIRAIALMSNVSLQAKMEQDHIHFNLNDKSFDIAKSELSAKKFLMLSGIPLPSNLLVHKPQGEVKDWNDLLMSPTPSPPSKYEIRR